MKQNQPNHTSDALSRSQSPVLSNEYLDNQLTADNHELTDTSRFDAGLRSNSYYSTRMSRVRFQLRSWLVKRVEKETDWLATIQCKVRNAPLDFYFPYTASFGSHTFYVLILPVPVWLGLPYRDLVYVLALGIYFTGAVKDYLCLPRPRSPPLTRITLSHYTSQEYGCPSSHTANATGVFLLLSGAIFAEWGLHSTMNSSLRLMLLILYSVSLIFGRIYCGMHGLTDIVVGALVGAFVYVFRVSTKTVWDYVLSQGSWLVPLGIVALHYGLIYYHPVPIDQCPCFEDSVAFIGVLIGLDLSHWLLANSRYAGPVFGSHYVPGSDSDSAITGSGWILRTLLGMGLVVLWKALSKSVLTVLFRPLHVRLFGRSKVTEQSTEKRCTALIPRHDLDHFVRLAVYSGISILVIWTNVLFDVVGFGIAQN